MMKGSPKKMMPSSMGKSPKMGEEKISDISSMKKDMMKKSKGDIEWRNK